ALEGERLSAERQADPENRLHAEVRVVFEARLAPLEGLEEELAGELFDAQRQSVQGVEPRVEDQPSQVLLAREVAGEELVEGGGRQRSASQQMDAEAMAGLRAGDVHDLAVSPVEDPPVAA